MPASLTLHLVSNYSSLFGWPQKLLAASIEFFTSIASIFGAVREIQTCSQFYISLSGSFR
jgi:hypothetical protein